MRIILHCSDSSFGNTAFITKWHVQGNGWKNIGYHFVILNGQLSDKVFNHYFDGHIETGRPINDNNFIEPFEFGAHTKGNNEAIGICLIGKSGKFTTDQYFGLESLLNKLKDQFGKLDIFQHSDFDSKKPFCSGLSQGYIHELNCKYNG